MSLADISCRQRIEHFTARRTRHIAEVQAARIAFGRASAWRASG